MYIEVALVYLIVTLLLAWYRNFAKRDQFKLPFDEAQYNQTSVLLENTNTFL